jgi:predicted RNA-binding protein YlxR (DUF448 family)
LIKPRKVSLRKCSGCQEMKDKRELVRITRTDSGVFSLDATGKMPGRGAYVCPNMECFEKAYKKMGLERSFRQPVPPEIYAQLKTELETRCGS